MGEALVGQGHLARMQVEIEARKDAHQGGDGDKAVGDTGLGERGERKQLRRQGHPRGLGLFSSIMYFPRKNT